MLKQGSFIHKKFDRLLLQALPGALFYAANLMTDSIVSGNQLGEVALQAVSIVYPVVSVIGLFSQLLPLGISVIFGKAMGEFRQEAAYRAAGTGIAAAALIGALLAGGLLLIRMPFLNYYGCTGEVLQYALAYYNWMIPCALINPMISMMYYLVITDGDSLLFTIGNIAGITANILLSVVLSHSMGIGGLGLATFIYMLILGLSFGSHFLKKTNNVKFHICLDFRTVIKALSLSLNEYMYYLFQAVVNVVINKIIIASCGIEYIPAYAVITMVFSLSEMYIAVLNASMGFITCFLGEKNSHDMAILFKRIAFSVLMIAITLTVIIFFGAPLIPAICGLTTPATIRAAVSAARIMAFTTLGIGTIYMWGSISGAVEKPLQSCLISFLNDLFSPLLLSLIFGSIWGFIGISIGMCLSSYLAIGIYTLVCIARKGKTGFPIYVEDFGNRASSYDLYITPETIVELRDAVGQELRNHGFEVKNIDLLMEELLIRILEKNLGRRVLAECTLLYEKDRVRIIVRDDGILFNFVDENSKVESLNAYVLNQLLGKIDRKTYLLTISFNRNGFVFAKETILEGHSRRLTKIDSSEEGLW